MTYILAITGATGVYWIQFSYENTLISKKLDLENKKTARVGALEQERSLQCYKPVLAQRNHFNDLQVTADIANLSPLFMKLGWENEQNLLLACVPTGNSCPS